MDRCLEVLLSTVVQQRVVILEFSQEKMSTRASTLPSCRHHWFLMLPQARSLSQWPLIGPKERAWELGSCSSTAPLPPGSLVAWQLGQRMWLQLSREIPPASCCHSLPWGVRCGEGTRVIRYIIMAYYCQESRRKDEELHKRTRTDENNYNARTENSLQWQTELNGWI